MQVKSKLKFKHTEPIRQQCNLTADPKGIKPSSLKLDGASMPVDSGSVVPFRKTAHGLRSVAVVALKAVSHEPDKIPAWATVANVLMPHQLALAFEQPVWTDLFKFGAYKRQATPVRQRASQAPEPKRPIRRTSVKAKFCDNYEALQDLVLLTGIDGEWRDLGNQKQYRAKSGAILNWWESTGTILFQGKASAAASFQETFQSSQPSSCG